MVYRANTNFTTIRSYMDMLIKNGLIEALPGSPVIYRTTSKGQAIRSKLRSLQEELDKISL